MQLAVVALAAIVAVFLMVAPARGAELPSCAEVQYEAQQHTKAELLRMARERGLTRRQIAERAYTCLGLKR